MGFALTVNRLRTAAGLTQEELAGMLDPPKTQAAVAAWEAGKSTPKLRTLDQLAAIFNVATSELLGERILPNGARIPTPSTATAPVMSLGYVHAGEPNEAIEEHVVMQIPADVASRHPNAFLLEVQGDCMNLSYPEGCMVLVDPDMTPRNGSAVVAEYMGDTVLRRYHRFTDTLILSSDSTNRYPDIVIRGDMDVRCLGTVVWFQSKDDER